MLISFKQNEFDLDWLYDYSESNTVKKVHLSGNV